MVVTTRWWSSATPDGGVVPLGDSNTSVCLAEDSCDLQANGTRLGDVVPVARYPGF